MLKTALTQFLGIILVLSPSLWGQQRDSNAVTAGSEFAQEILSRLSGLPSLAVSFQNLSSMPPEMQEAAQNAVFTAVKNAGIRLLPAETAAGEIQIAFSEDWKEYLWIANIKSPSGARMLTKKVPRLQPITVPSTQVLVLHKAVLWQQEGPILDFYREAQNMVLLEPDQISVYANDGGQWRLRQTLAITHPRPWPRDLRGRLMVNGLQISASMPGTMCTGSLAPPALDCRASDDPWQVDQGTLTAFFSATRNFFTGVLAGQNAGASVPPFFSGATWPGASQKEFLFAGTDGRARLFENDLAQPAATFNGWGSTLAVIHSGCGPGWQLLVSAPRDAIRPDTIQAVEIAGHEALPASSGIDFPGPVKALWTSGKNADVVNGIMQLPGKERYEAFTLSVTCGQ